SDTAAAEAAVLDHYRQAALCADLTLLRRRWRLEEAAEAEPLADRRSALEWWQREGPAVDALIRKAYQAGEHEAVTRLVDSCKGRFVALRPYERWAELTRLGLEAARAGGDRPAEGAMLLSRSQLWMCSHRFPDAETIARQALALWRDLDDTQGAGSACEVLAQALAAQDRPTEALPIAEEAIAHHERVGSPRGVALQWRFYAQILARTGAHARAHLYFTEALAVFREQDDAYQVVQVLTRRVPTLIALGRLQEAGDGAAEALETARQTGQAVQTGNALAALADIAAARGHDQEEQRLLHQAHQVLAPLEVPEADRIAERLHRP